MYGIFKGNGKMRVNPGDPMIKRSDTLSHVHMVSIFVLVVLLATATQAGPIPVTEYLRETLDKIIEVLNDPSLKTPDKENERRTILLKVVRGRFDEEEFAMRALGAHWQERSTEEKQEFIEAFSDLLERTYLEKIDAYLGKAGTFSSRNIQYLDETAKGSYVVVATKIVTGDDAEIPVLYLFKSKGGNWLVCDVAIEGVSIAKNYRAQFDEILARSSFKELIARLKSKQEKGVAGQGK
jgi:phospholipid transport system substrate-binding protein